ncbi:exonuclease [Pedobacter sp. HMWF019]|uniref:exonuclease n=1 Tax=Pedobacter sp. HMWF019 TaxID=2056856 RepID=UPI000D38BBE7|nr:exonuclease [Pedobacter sp. HMWF019]PTS99278.1 exonuclease [Pedobacter sp. HMWF019]
MIAEDFLVQTKIGLYCVYGDFYLDPKEPVRLAVISHAHGDHAVPGNAKVYCGRATSLFMRHRYREAAAGEFYIKAYHEAFEINGVTLHFIPAGHILGSAQILMAYQGTRYLYTGDFKLQNDPTCEPFEFVEADVLITETTFANPETQHPDPEEEIKKLNSTDLNIMLGAYVLGKSQRLLELMNQHCKEKKILVHHSILPFIKIYEQEGRPLGAYEIFDKRILKANVNNLVYLVPPMVFNSNVKTLNVIKVFATGWKDLQKMNQMQLYLSDHADWKDILYTISQVKPREVWTTHGSGHQLKFHYQESLVVKLLN